MPELTNDQLALALAVVAGVALIAFLTTLFLALRLHRVRRDFRVLAFWLGSVTTGADGRASIDVTLPESLTTYRIMAVAADRGSRFGADDTEVRTNKPLLHFLPIERVHHQYEIGAIDAQKLQRHNALPGTGNVTRIRP